MGKFDIIKSKEFSKKSHYMGKVWQNQTSNFLVDEMKLDEMPETVKRGTSYRIALLIELI